jgi:hypothetical protein
MGTRPRFADVCRLQGDAWPAKKKGQVLPAPFREVSRKVPEAEEGEVGGRGAKRQGSGRGSERGIAQKQERALTCSTCVSVSAQGCEGATSSTHSCTQRASEACLCSCKVRVCGGGIGP